MAKAKLLLRETLSDQSLTSVVDRARRREPPHQEYELRLNSVRLEIIRTQRTNAYTKTPNHDEGFESDVDSLSIVSSDESLTSTTEDNTKREIDSANGSSSSESDTEVPITKTDGNYPLVDVLCYTDVKSDDVLIFVIREDCLVFGFENVDHLQQFYSNFNALKAVTNQRTYGNASTIKFNLLQRTDSNGVTHIEITKEPLKEKYDEVKTTVFGEKRSKENLERNPYIASEKLDSLLSSRDDETYRSLETNYISNTPKCLDDSKVFLDSELISRNEFYPTKINSMTLKPRVKYEDGSLTKVWKSADDLLDVPKRPERRRRPKGKAPPPPGEPQKNVLRGQFVRVAVEPKVANDERANVQTFSPNWNSLKHPLVLATVTRQEPSRGDLFHGRAVQSWTDSVPRLLKKPRSRSETRNVFPIAHRYIDATRLQIPHQTGTISNRLFGLSQKLKEFGSSVVSGSNRGYSYYEAPEPRRNSLGDIAKSETNLKSVIKKDDKKKGGQKKVSFSAYATVQVV